MKSNMLYLIRGVPGAGKSTFAKTLAEGIGGEHFEADSFFVNAKGQYNFDATLLKHAHAHCLESTRQVMQRRMKDIVVSNTFTTQEELDPYIKLATFYGYQVTTMIIENRHGNPSVHNVPEDTIEKMKDRFQIQL